MALSPGDEIRLTLATIDTRYDHEGEGSTGADVPLGVPFTVTRLGRPDQTPNAALHCIENK